MESVGLDSDSIGLHTADAGAIAVVRDLNVAFVTPVNAPSVLQDVVVQAIFKAVANGEDKVVNIWSAVGVIKDTARVHLERARLRIYSNDDWASSNSLLERSLAFLLHKRSALDVHGSLGRIIPALTRAHRIVGLRLKRVL